MTTDTFPKGATRSATIDGVRVTINGFAKGSGMIAPDMATMLAYVFTDAAMPAPVLQALLDRGNERSFNCDHGRRRHLDQRHGAALRDRQGGDTGRPDAAPTRALKDFRRALDAVLIELAQQIVRDGEGAQKFVTIEVTGAASIARRRGASGSRSAIRRWSRPRSRPATPIGAASSWRSARPARRPTATGLRSRSAASGSPKMAAPVAGYDEAPVARHMAGRDIPIAVDLGIGRGRATVWTCDLTHRYIDINGSYRS